MSAREPDGSSPISLWGAELRHYRNKAGVTQEELGKQIGYTAAHVGYLEHGKRTPGRKVAAACDEALDTPDHELTRWHDRLVKQEAFPPSFRPWYEVEQEARTLREFAPVLVPGLLQTEQYASYVLKGDADAVAARLARQEVLDNVAGKYVLDYAVLSRPIGDADVMQAQLHHIIDVASSGTVKVLISLSGSVPSVSGAFTLATLSEETLGYLEAETRGIVLTEREDVLDVEEIFEDLLTHAQSPNESLDTIRKAAEQWKT